MDSTLVIHLLSLFSVALLAVPLVGNAIPVFRSAGRRMRTSGPGARWVLAAAVVLCALVLFRPHEDTFVGVDTSALRLMTRAFKAGRGFEDVDSALLEVPSELRQWVLFTPFPRYTRDRSFEITSLETGETRLFLYPLVPFSMIGFDLLVPGDASDYLVPSVGFLFFLLCLLAAFRWAGGPGALLAAVLLLGSPVPQWLFRGCVMESVCTALVCSSMLGYSLRDRERDPQWPAFLGLGLAVSYHPLMIIPALGVALLMVVHSHESTRGDLARLGVFACGVMPIILTTLFICQPYGSLSLVSIRGNLVSASYRIAFVFGLMLLCAGALMLATQKLWVPWATRLMARRALSIPLMAVVSVLPTLLAIRFWSEGRFVRNGLVNEFLGALQWPLGLLLAVLLVIAWLQTEDGFSKVVLVFGFLCLPVFLYLAGKEHVGLWSQRRLLLPLMLFFTALIVSVCPQLESWLTRVKRHRRPLVVAVSVVLLLVLPANAIRWPAPYAVRFERGATEWLRKMEERFGGRLTVFDYVHYSAPFAATGKQRVLGITDVVFSRHKVFRDEIFRDVGYPRLLEWLREKALGEEVLLVTAFDNPGLEEGLSFEEVSREKFSLERIRNKRALPAVRAYKDIEVSVCRVRPVEAAGAPTAMHKIFDGGYLGLRPPWGRRDIPIELPDGRRLPACWSKEHSGIVGPIPEAGGSVEIEVVGTAGRLDGESSQVLVIKPPWKGKPLRLEVANELTTVSGVLKGPRRGHEQEKTGIYRIYSENPYDPATVGIKGFERDLGARIHSLSIRISE